jgi:O-antigen ligase
MKRIDDLRYWLLVAVAVYLPLQTLLPNLAGKMGAGSKAVLLLQIMPELLILAGLALTVVLWIKEDRRPFKPTGLDYLVVATLLWAALSSLWSGHSLGQDIVGLRLDFDGLLGFLFVRSLNLQREQLLRLKQIFVWQIGLLVGFGLFAWAFLPKDFLGAFGWSPAFRTAGKIIQAHSIFSGPNQMATALTLFAAVTLAAILLAPKDKQNRPVQLLLLSIGILSGLSYSRSGWLGMGLFAGVVFLLLLANRSKRWIWPVVLMVALVGAALFGMLRYHDTFATVLGHKFSTRQHAAASGAAISRDVSRPTSNHTLFGLGIGSAGPASYRLAHPLIEESWYLQLIDELGLVGLVLWFALIATIFWRWIRIKSALIQGLALALAGISLNAAFLHVWADNYYIQIAFWLIVGLLWQREKESEQTLLR